MAQRKNEPRTTTPKPEEKSLTVKIEQLSGLIGTKSVDEETSTFLEMIVDGVKARRGDITWISPGRSIWLSEIYAKHFA